MRFKTLKFAKFKTCPNLSSAVSRRRRRRRIGRLSDRHLCLTPALLSAFNPPAPIATEQSVAMRLRNKSTTGAASAVASAAASDAGPAEPSPAALASNLNVQEASSVHPPAGVTSHPAPPAIMSSLGEKGDTHRPNRRHGGPRTGKKTSASDVQKKGVKTHRKGARGDDRGSSQHRTGSPLKVPAGKVLSGRI